MKKFNIKKGFGLIEIIVAAAIISVSFLSLMSVANISYRVLQKSSHNLRVGFLLEEGVEAVKIMRDSGWDNISFLNNGADYYLYFNGSTWIATTSLIYTDDIFERKFVLSEVLRDANDDISSSGVVDPDTKKVTISVFWEEKGNISVQSFSTYISNLFE